MTCIRLRQKSNIPTRRTQAVPGSFAATACALPAPSDFRGFIFFFVLPYGFFSGSGDRTHFRKWPFSTRSRVRWSRPDDTKRGGDKREREREKKKVYANGTLENTHGD